MKEDKVLKRLLLSADTQAEPPEGVRERIFDRVISVEIRPELQLSSVERFFFEKPLRAACAVAAPVTAALWVVTGGNFIGLLNGLIR